MSLHAEEYDAPPAIGPSKAFIDSVLQEQDRTPIQRMQSGFIFCRDLSLSVWRLLRQATSTLFLEWASDSLGSLGEAIDWKKLKSHKKALQFQHQHPHYRYTTNTLPSPLETPLTLYKVTQNTKQDTKKGGLIMPDQNETITDRHLSTLRKTNPWLKDILRQSWMMAVQPPPESMPSRNTRVPKKNRAKTVSDEPNGGLDDLFTRPIHNFFDGDNDLSLSKPASRQKQQEQPKLKSNLITTRLDKELRQLIELCRKTYNEVVPNSPSPETASTFDQSSATEPVHSDADPENNLPAPATEPIQQSNIQPVQAGWQTLPETTAQIDLDTTASRLKPVTIASNAQSKAKAANLQIPVYQEMKSEFSGTEHMVRNNRILHNSISKLTDAYFQKAAQEAAPDYY